MMKIFICALILSLSLITIIADDRKLQIGVKKRLLNCETKTKKGDFLHVHYRAMYENEVEFDSSYNTKPFTFTLGLGQVIKGWDQGLLGMCVGEIRKLVVPPHLAYGLKGVPPTIPPDETLIFFIELLNIEERDEL